MKKSTVIVIILAVLLFAGVILISLTNEWGYEKVFLSRIKTATLVICEDCKKDFGDLRIDVKNLKEDDYVDANGEKQRGNVAGLVLSARDGSFKNKVMVVYEGQSFRIDKYDVLVEKIDIGVKADTGLIGTAMGGVRLKITHPTSE